LLRIVNVLGYEISLETGFHGSSSYPTRPVPRRVAACRIHALHELTGADNVDTDAGRSHRTPGTGHRALDTGHRTPDIGHQTPDTGGHRTPDTGGHRDTGHRTPDTGHRTPDARTPDARRLDTYRTPDTGRADAGHADVDGGRGQGDQGTVGIGGHHDAAVTANLVAVAAAAHAAFGNHDGSAVRPPASARDCRLHCQAAAGSLRRRPAAPRRTAVLGKGWVESSARR
jgi:hypothetical protein